MTTAGVIRNEKLSCRTAAREIMHKKDRLPSFLCFDGTFGHRGAEGTFGILPFSEPEGKGGASLPPCGP